MEIKMETTMTREPARDKPATVVPGPIPLPPMSERTPAELPPPLPVPEPIPPQPRNSFFSLVRDLTQETRTLFRQEVTLAKTEITEKIQHLTRNSVALGVGGTVAYAGLIVLLIGLGFLAAWAIQRAGIQPLLASFLGLLFIGLLTAGIGGFLILRGLHEIKHQSLAPKRTLQTLKDLQGGKIHGGHSEPAAYKPSSEEMQARVQATEGRMGETLDELGRRLDPHHLSEQVKFRIHENPFGAGLIAMVAGVISGLLLQRRRKA
jgi:hypothetical protein